MKVYSKSDATYSISNLHQHKIANTFNLKMNQILSLFIIFVSSETWKITNPNLWASPDCDKLSKDVSNEIINVVFQTEEQCSYAITGQMISCQPGDIIEYSAMIKYNGQSPTYIQCIPFKGKDPLSWTYGTKSFTHNNTNFEEIKFKVTIPYGASSFYIRFTGRGHFDISIKNWIATKVGHIQVSTTELIEFKTKEIKVNFHPNNGTWSVVKGNHKWIWENNALLAPITNLKVTKKSFQFRINKWEEGMDEYTILCEISNNDLFISISCDDNNMEQTNVITYLTPIISNENERIILPYYEGISGSTKDWIENINYLACHGGGLKMEFFGVTEDKENGYGYILSVLTPDDAAISIGKGKNGLYSGYVRFIPQKGKFGYTRKVRYSFVSKGGYVALAKKYRQICKEKGILKTFNDKIKNNPNLEEGINKLIGSANIWAIGGRLIDYYSDMQSLGINRILSSNGGSAADIEFMNNNFSNVLTSEYDIYQDIMDPANKGLVSWNSGWIDSAFPDDCILDSNGNLITGWSVDPISGKGDRIFCNVLCDIKAIAFARERIKNRLSTHKYKCRFIDTTMASLFRECYHPDHEMTHTTSKEKRLELLKLVGNEFNLVSGTEDGHECAVPYIDYCEGMMSLGRFRISDSGRYMYNILNDSTQYPSYVEEFQLGYQYRLPLWELVFHDCCVAYWYWGDYNNKMPLLWRKRDLFNCLYGVPPMYLFNKTFYQSNRERFAESYKVAQPVSELTGKYEMISHRILNKERSVQQTEFANGVTVTVNFGDKNYKMKDGYTLLSQGYRIEIDNSRYHGKIAVLVVSGVIFISVIIFIISVKFSLIHKNKSNDES